MMQDDQDPLDRAPQGQVWLTQDQRRAVCRLVEVLEAHEDDGLGHSIYAPFGRECAVNDETVEGAITARLDDIEAHAQDSRAPADAGHDRWLRLWGHVRELRPKFDAGGDAAIRAAVMWHVSERARQVVDASASQAG